MTWPAPDSSSNIATTNTDAGTDSPASARTDMLALINEVNSLKALVNSIINNGQPITIAGSEAATAFVNAAYGAKFGNVDRADAATLDYYQEGSFTPTISLGGTALTATSAVGRYVRIGGVVFVLADLLFSKGSSTGSLTVGGLPYSPFSSATQLFPARLSQGVSLSGALQIEVFGSSATVYQSTSTGRSVVTDANLPSVTTGLTFTGVYRAA